MIFQYFTILQRYSGNFLNIHQKQPLPYVHVPRCCDINTLIRISVRAGRTIISFFCFFVEIALVIKDEGVQKAVKRARTRGARTLQARDPNIMQGSGKWNPVCLIPGRKPDRRTRLPLEISQRKETHNLKERDRRYGRCLMQTLNKNNKKKANKQKR